MKVKLAFSITCVVSMLPSFLRSLLAVTYARQRSPAVTRDAGFAQKIGEVCTDNNECKGRPREAGGDTHNTELKRKKHRRLFIILIQYSLMVKTPVHHSLIITSQAAHPLPQGWEVTKTFDLSVEQQQSLKVSEL